MIKRSLLMTALALALGCAEPPPGQEEVQPIFSEIQVKVLTPSCALSGCHNEASKKGGLILVEGQSFAEMVDVPAQQAGALADGKILVIPGDPDNSYLIQKLEGPESGEGLEMPPGARVISDAAILAIREWVAQGAQNN